MTASVSSTQSARPLAHLSGTILLAGAGKMGSALLEGWLALGLAPEHLVIIEPAPAGHLPVLAKRGVRLNPPQDAIGEVAAVMIAVKPQVAPEVMPVLRPLVGAATVAVSIMAGRTLRFLETALPGAALIRAMPNT
ncbi:MAG: pyrroline-5-carboxylate reductase family protein, partial [Xanthobacteraceae bacterium]